MTPAVSTTSRGISGSTLKIIAMFCMFLDHIGAALLEPLLYARGFTPNLTPEAFDTLLADNYALYFTTSILRTIGRAAFPIFCFLLIQGFCNTHSRLKYARNLFLFALISEVPFDLAFNGAPLELSSQNVFFTLVIALAALCLIDLVTQTTYSTLVQALLTLAVTLTACALAQTLHTDYGAFGILAITVMYLLRTQKVTCALAGCLILTLLDPSEYFALLCLIPIRLYNGTRGISLKYLFYAFYPLHLLLFSVIAHYLI